MASAPDEYRQSRLDNLVCAACGIKTAGIASGLVIGTGEPFRYRKAIDPNGSGLDKRNSRTHSVFFFGPLFHNGSYLRGADQFVVVMLVRETGKERRD